jgi:hypothetical protein
MDCVSEGIYITVNYIKNDVINEQKEAVFIVTVCGLEPNGRLKFSVQQALQ